MFRLKKQFKFEASHQLMRHDGKCRRLHGHSWVGYVVLEGYSLEDQGPKEGMLFDYGDVSAPLKKLVNDKLDHYHLNETLEMDMPTSERLAEWVYKKVTDPDSGYYIPYVRSVIIQETCTSECEYIEDGISHLQGKEIE